MGIIINGQNDTIGPVDDDMTLLGTVSIGGTMTIEDFTNVDSVGLITARNGLHVTGGNVDIGGATHSRNLSVHDATNGVILIEGASNGTSNLMFADENDEDVGMLGYNHASNYLAFTVNAAERLRITSGGNTGIGTDNPGHLLDLYNSAGSDCLRLNVNGGAGGSNKQNAIRFSVDGDVKAHMGLAVDAGRLISGSIANDFCLKGLGSNNILFATNSSEKLRITTAGDMGLGTATPTSFGPTFQVAGTDPALLLQDTATAVDYFGINVQSGAVINWFDDSAYFAIGTAAGLSGSAYSERLRITSSGVVGINTDVSNNPSGSKLVVGGRIQSNAGGYWFAGANGAEDGWHVQDSGGNLVVVESGVAERLRIDSSGRALIGTATNRLGEALHVLGNGIVTSSAENTNMMIFGTFGSSDALIGSFNSIPLIFRTANTERLRITTAGNIGLQGNTAPLAKVHIGTLNNSALSVQTLFVEGAKTGYANYTGLPQNQLCLYDNTASTAGSGGAISFAADCGGSQQTWIAAIESQRDSSTNDASNYAGSIVFWTRPAQSTPTEKLRILSSGGITFNGDTAAANALDDYEEGSWTPTYLSGLNSASYSNTTGTYTKIGNLVTFTLRIQATGTNVGSHARITGLPFTSSTDKDEGSATFGYVGNLPGNQEVDIYLHIPGNSININFYYTSGAQFFGNGGNGLNGKTLHIRGFYYT